MGNEIENYLDIIKKNHKELATVQIGNFQTEKTKVIVKKVEETFFLVFEEPKIISLIRRTIRVRSKV